MIKPFFNYFYNKIGWKTDRRLVVITSDDWGGIRVESRENQLKLINAGFSMSSNRFNKYDTLESNSDLELLFEILSIHKDSKGNNPVITAMTNVANPDFKKIKENNFTSYYFEEFTETLKKYPNHKNVYDLYQTGIKNNIFIPEFHGREHLNVKNWMNALRNKNSKVRKAFDYNFFMMDANDLTPQLNKGFGAAYDLEILIDINEHNKIISSGLNIFAKKFGYGATFFTAPSLIYNSELDSVLHLKGIKIIDVNKLQKMPIGNNKHKTKIHYLGQRNKYNQIYIQRNAVFEPNISQMNDTVSSCLSQIEEAFKFGKPAIISNHRASFIGGIDKNNRGRGLRSLNKLLFEITKKWPDVEFVSMRKLGEIILSNSRNEF